MHVGLCRSRGTTASHFSTLFCTLLGVAATMSPGAARAADEINGADTAWILTCSALVLMMTLPGLALFYGGLVRVKNLLSVLMQCMIAAGLVGVLWVIAGYSLAFGEGNSVIGDLSMVMLSGITPDSVSGSIPTYVFVPTRIFRAIRFEQRMGFTIGKHTEKLLKNAVKMNLFNRFFGHRCFTELKLIFSEENPIPAIRRMAEFDLLKFILPGLKFDKAMERNLAETQRAMAWYKLLYLDESCHQWLVYLFAILAKSTYSDLKVFCMKFEFT